LYERYREPLLGYLVRLTGGRQLGEDVFQEVWIKVIEGIHGYRPDPGPFRAWLYRVAHNAAVDRLRREGKHVGVELDATADDEGPRRADLLPSDEPGPDRLGADHLMMRRMRSVLARLTATQRAAVLLRHQQGLSYRELSAVLGVPENTAKTTVHRAVLILREHMAEWIDE
jgi:RNA polymerase sigma-70 factor (ECF subfamily)